MTLALREGCKLQAFKRKIFSKIFERKQDKMRNTLGYIMTRNVVIYTGHEDLLTPGSARDRAGNIWMALEEIRMA